MDLRGNPREMRENPSFPWRFFHDFGGGDHGNIMEISWTYHGNIMEISWI
jgi:hypothetical protein